MKWLTISTLEANSIAKTYWHTCSHLWAVKRLYPDVKLAIGPAIDITAFTMT